MHSKMCIVHISALSRVLSLQIFTVHLVKEMVSHEIDIIFGGVYTIMYVKLCILQKCFLIFFEKLIFHCLLFIYSKAVE